MSIISPKLLSFRLTLYSFLKSYLLPFLTALLYMQTDLLLSAYTGFTLRERYHPNQTINYFLCRKEINI